jgi:hypothetical protein
MSAQPLAKPHSHLDALAAGMSERYLEDGIRRILKDLPGILAYHTFISKRSASGLPDWIFTSARGVMWRELKRVGEEPTSAQQQWLDTLRASGQDADTWWPADLLSGRCARELAALAGVGGSR